MDGFNEPSFYKFSLSYEPHSAIAEFDTFHFTAAHTLRLLASTSRCFVADLNTGTITSSHYEVFLSFLYQSPWNAYQVVQF
jgi:hypothetical protein